MVEWIGTEEIMQICGCKERKARAIKNEIHDRIRNGGHIVPDRKKIPKHLVLEYLGINPKEETECLTKS